MLTSVLDVKDKVLMAEVAAGVASVEEVQGLPCAKPVAKTKLFGRVCGTSVKTYLRWDRRMEGRGNRGNKQ